MDNNMGSRIDELIKALKIKKVRFAEQLGIDQSYVTQLTNGRRNPSDLLIGAICRKFNVNEAWLRTGEGGDAAMFLKPPQDEDLAAQIESFFQGGTDSFRERLVSLLLRLPQDKWDVLEGYARELAAPREAAPARTDDDVEQDVAKQAVENFRYRSSLEKNPEAESSPSSEDGAETA